MRDVILLFEPLKAPGLTFKCSTFDKLCVWVSYENESKRFTKQLCLKYGRSVFSVM